LLICSWSGSMSVTLNPTCSTAVNFNPDSLANCTSWPWQMISLPTRISYGRSVFRNTWISVNSLSLPKTNSVKMHSFDSTTDPPLQTCYPWLPYCPIWHFCLFNVCVIAARVDERFKLMSSNQNFFYYTHYSLCCDSSSCATADDVSTVQSFS